MAHLKFELKSPFIPLFFKECFMSLRSPTENENADFVMPAWIAGIQARKDASGDIRVDLDSSAPCWNDAIEETQLELTEAPPTVFSKEFSVQDFKPLRSMNSGQALAKHVLSPSATLRINTVEGREREDFWRDGEGIVWRIFETEH
jgi:hypothetical protein